MSGDTTINQKGTKTRPRAATHSARLVSGGAWCPRCGSRHILESVASNSPAAYWCGQCGAFFDEPAHPRGLGA